MEGISHDIIDHQRAIAFYRVINLEISRTLIKNDFLRKESLYLFFHAVRKTFFSKFHVKVHGNIFLSWALHI